MHTVLKIARAASLTGVFLAFPAPRCLAAGEIPLVANYTMEPPADARALADNGPLHIDGRLTSGVEYSTPGRDGTGHALRFSGEGDGVARIDKGKFLHRLGAPLSVSLWIKPQAWAEPGRGAALLTKTSQSWISKAFALSIGDNGSLGFEGSEGNGSGWTGPILQLNKWQHVAFTFAPGGQRILYLNGQAVSQAPAGPGLYNNEEPLFFGYENGYDGPGGYRSKYKGEMDDVHIYAAALSGDQIRADMIAPLAPTRAATESDLAPRRFRTTLRLARFDWPLGLRDYRGQTRAGARRTDGPDALDFPALTLTNGDGTAQTLFEKEAEQTVDLPEFQDAQGSPVFRQPYDSTISPGDHWVRAHKLTLWGRRDVYSTDATLRGGRDLEIWAFPIRISGEPIASVEVKSGAQIVYQRTFVPALHSLTLQLPQAAYSVTVNNRAPVSFAAGLQPLQSGDPRWNALVVNAPIAGTKLRIENAPRAFVHQKEWDDDLAAVSQAAPLPFEWTREVRSFPDFVGVEVPRSPLSIYATSLTHGMSGGFLYHSEQGPAFSGSADNYAQFLADNGYDLVFEQSINGYVLDRARDVSSYENWLAALGRHGVRGGLNVNSLNNSHQALFGANLVEFHAPKFRDAQLMAGRFARFPNFAGMAMGADNAQYSWYWDWNGPSSEHPFGMALSTLFAQSAPVIPAAPAWTELKSYQQKTTQQQFLRYIARFDSAYKKNGEYFGRAVREVNPALAITSGSYGSESGVGARGGHWSTLPGKAMFEGLPVAQAYDWDETDVVKPLQNVALTDRLRSYFPDKPAWSLLDDFRLKFGRETMQRQYALALTRGIEGMGVSFLANPTNQKEWNKPDYSNWRRDMHAWAHRYGGVYARTQPRPSVGILYVNAQALSRTVVGNKPDAPDAALLAGSHGGKTSEALFFCQAAGWPAKIVTPEELRRGLAPSVHTLLLVGLNRFDGTWNWYDGLTPDLKRFVARGGRLVSDAETVAPPGVPVENLGLQVRAYVEQGEHVAPAPSTDRTALLYARNRDNIAKLRALKNAAPPLCASDDPAIWTIPTQTGGVQYVTVVNYAAPAGQNATHVFEPRTAALRWNSARPIYDVRLRRKLTPAEAATVDLTRNAFALYALPPRAVGVPRIALARGADGFWSAKVGVGAPDMDGVPVEIAIEKGGQKATVWGATGSGIKLPIHASLPGAYSVTATELLSGLRGKATVSVPAAPKNAPATHDTAIARFFARQTVPLTVALTPSQFDDAAWQKAAALLVGMARAAGRRNVTVARLEPGTLVTGLQVVGGAQSFPRWQTIESDIVLLGTPNSNVLLLDQARGFLLPQAAFDLSRGAYSASASYSPFVGEYDALNLVSPDASGVAAFIHDSTKLQKKTP